MVFVDDVKLQFGGKTYSNFLSYSIDSDLLFTAGAFTIELADKKTPVEVGEQCKIFINGNAELTGFIEKISYDDNKETTNLKVSGRDVMGLLVDACCEVSDCKALENVSLVNAARRMVRKIPLINHKDIIMQIGCEKQAVPHGMLQVEPGSKIFDILSRYASMRGLIFYCLPNGVMVFGKPKARRLAGEPVFCLVREFNGINNNIKSCTIEKDISKGASKVTVISQGIGDDAYGGSEILESFENPDFLPGFYKPLTIIQNGDKNSPAALAKMTVEKMRREIYSLTYKVAGHSQNGGNWHINNWVSVQDEYLGIHGDFLVYGRTFTNSKNNGKETELRLAKGGLP
jgi:prophage tail gpP-like protein